MREQYKVSSWVVDVVVMTVHTWAHTDKHTGRDIHANLLWQHWECGSYAASRCNQSSTWHTAQILSMSPQTFACVIQHNFGYNCVYMHVYTLVICDNKNEVVKIWQFADDCVTDLVSSSPGGWAHTIASASRSVSQSVLTISCAGSFVFGPHQPMCVAPPGKRLDASFYA